MVVGYQCKYNKGYKLMKNGKTCKGENYMVGYQCKCNKGYELMKDGKMCKGENYGGRVPV